jgi:hypothetical protein
MPTLSVLDGFEHGSVGAVGNGPYDLVNGTPVIVTSPVRTGLRALEVVVSAATKFVQYTVASQRVSMSFYLRLASSLPADAAVFAQILNSTSGTSSLRYDTTTGKLEVTIVGGGGGQVGPVLELDTWYRIDWEYDTSTTELASRVRVDGGTEFTATKTSTIANSSACVLGAGAASTETVYFDDWVISQTAGDYPLGGYHVEPLNPSEDGVHNITTSGDFDGTTTQFSNATTDSYLNIDDVPLNSSNTDGEVIRQDLGTTDEYMEHLYSNLPAGPDVPIDVRVYAVDVDGADTGTNLAVLKFLLEDGTPLMDVRLSSDDPGTTVTWRKKMLARPIGGWVGSHVDGLKSRWGFSDADPDAILLGVLVEVAMTAPPPPPPESFPTRRSLVA